MALAPDEIRKRNGTIRRVGVFGSSSLRAWLAGRLNDMFASYLRSGYDVAKSLQLVVSEAVEPDSGISEQELQQFLGQFRVAAIIADHMDDSSIRWVASLRSPG